MATMKTLTGYIVTLYTEDSRAVISGSVCLIDHEDGMTLEGAIEQALKDQLEEWPDYEWIVEDAVPMYDE